MGNVPLYSCHLPLSAHLAPCLSFPSWCSSPAGYFAAIFEVLIYLADTP